jgi:excinuclease ABC subunit B
MAFKSESEYQPTGDQPQAIDQLAEGINQGLFAQTLLGVPAQEKLYRC